MPAPVHQFNFAALLAALGAVLALGGCGGSGVTVVRIAGAPGASISRPTLDHWMQAIAGGDFRESVGVEGPRGLVSEPADYPRCVVAAKLVAPRSFFNQLRPTERELERECQALDRSVKAQALSFLISAEWTIAEAAERGIRVSAGEVDGALGRFRAQRAATEQGLGSYLAERHWSLSDLLYELKVELLAARLRRSASFQRTGAGERAYAALAERRRRRLAARTHCRPGYVVPGCSEYRGAPPPARAPEAILKNLVHNPR